MEISPIAYAYNGFTEKFGIPRQSGCAPSVLTRIVFEPEFRMAEAFRGIEQWSHLWLIWGFSGNEGWSPTVRPPRLGGNTRVGVFATRSPFRPNGLGLSSVRLEKVDNGSDGLVLVVSGADLMNGTPVFDVKPYLPYTDIHPDAASGFVTCNNGYRLQVVWEKDAGIDMPDSIVTQLCEILSEDPRPAYKKDGDGQEYGLSYAGWNVMFTVAEGTLYVKKTKKVK